MCGNQERKKERERKEDEEELQERERSVEAQIYGGEVPSVNFFFSLFKRVCSPDYQSFTATTNPPYELVSSLCLLIFFKFLFMAEDLDVGFSDFLIQIDISICDLLPFDFL
jgi:hypothetical protein